jgi:hypothetical protein
VKELEAWMNKNSYFPNIWWISDHGNANNITLKSLKEDANAILYGPGGGAGSSKKPSNKVTLTCQECGKKWKVSSNANDPDCPKCGGTDYEVD